VLPANERREIDRRILEVPLGFSPHTYHWNPQTARHTREKFEVRPTDVVVAFSCRFSAPRKEERNRRTLTGIRSALEAHSRLHAVLVGFGDDSVSTRLKRFVRQGAVSARIHCLPFAEQEGLNELYNAADVAVFPNASISCQAALGTGLTVCLANNGTMDHLIRSGSQAVFFDPARLEDLCLRLTRLAELMVQWPIEKRLAKREEMAASSRWLGYDRLCASVLERIVSQPVECERTAVRREA
jgi:glycosyltransferase involved in cell wall biosynthesis